MPKFKAPSAHRKMVNAFSQVLEMPPAGGQKRSQRQQRKIEAAVKRSRVADQQYQQRARRPKQ